MKTYWLSRTFVLGSVVLLAGCSESTAAKDSKGNDAGGDSAPTGPAPIESMAAGWTAVQPGGDTTCARGTPYQFFVRPGTVNRVIFDFEGGGACWDELTCSVAGSLFKETVEVAGFVSDESTAVGFYDHTDARNPFKDWHHIYVPYCTGDVHWGDAVRTYGAGASDAGAPFTIHHQGAVNVRAVLDWAYENVPSPAKAFVTGCSAGAYGAALWSAHIRNHYKDSSVYQFADSGAGIITDTFFQESFPQWNAVANYPTFITDLDPASFTRLPQLYSAIGTFFDDMFLSQYNTEYDDNQHFYYQAMGGGDVFEWSALMHERVDETIATTPNFRSYIAPGHQHCILPYPNFYEVVSGGVLLTDWLKGAVEDRPVTNVSCGADCGQPLQPTP